MGRSAELWMDEQERIMENIDAGKIEEDMAVEELKRLGFDEFEALDLIQMWRM